MTSTDAEHTRDRLLVVLAVVTGATDATAFERLGHVFASVITGNLILLGVSAVSDQGSLALFAGCALVGYGVGVFLAAPRGPSGDGVWPRGVSPALTLDLALLVAFAVAWEIVGGRPSHSMQVVLVAIAAGAMGVQSSAVRRMGQMSTTYLTSTLTGLVESIATRRWSGSQTRGLAIIAAAVVGAGAGTLVLRHGRAWLPCLQLVPLVIVLVRARELAAQPSAG